MLTTKTHSLIPSGLRLRRRLSLANLLFCIIFASFMLVVLHQYLLSVKKTIQSNSLSAVNDDDNYDEMALDVEKSSGEEKRPTARDLDEGIKSTSIAPLVSKGKVSESKAADLYKKIRVLCWILTSPDHYTNKAKAVKETWGKRCNILLFMSIVDDPSLPAIKLNVSEGRDGLWGKTREAFRYVWNNYRDQADWFYKADDDTYAIMENMRYFLSGFNTSKPMWFGHKFQTIVKQGYFSGGAGYVLSKEATRRFVEQGYHDATVCRPDHGGAEDAEMGRCLMNLGVRAMDSRDSKGRGRFFPFIPENHVFPGKIDRKFWYWSYQYYPAKEGLGPVLDCCSDTLISFHYIQQNQMYLMDFLIYHVRPYGLEDESRPYTPEPPPDLLLTATPWVLPPEKTPPPPPTSEISTRKLFKRKHLQKRSSLNQLTSPKSSV